METERYESQGMLTERPARAEKEIDYKSSPWGAVQSCDKIAEGIYSITTASHGGIKLSRQRNRIMPDYMRCEGGWYEEDCDWCLPFVVFQADLMAAGEEYSVRSILGNQHIETMRNWHPEKFEKWFEVEILPGKSHLKDQRLFNEEHKNDYIGTSAFGDWHETVPEGFVGVIAKPGGRAGLGMGNELRVLVPANEYGARSRFGFVVNPDLYQYWPKEN